jgi:hypothetical protein
MRHRCRVVPKLVALLAIVFLSNCVTAQEPFPNINNAEGQLYGALNSLHQAPPEFGGHKAHAVSLIQGAINELERAKQYAD